jgi:TonB family protein
VLQLFPRDQTERKSRWGWLVLSVCFLTLSAYFLYPALELTTSGPDAAQAVGVAPVSAAVANPVSAETAEPVAIETLGKTLTPPNVIQEVRPYAPEGIRNRIGGRRIVVDVMVSIDRNGRPGRVKIIKPSGADSLHSYLSQRAAEAVRQWKFQPARIDQQAIPAELTIRFQFHRSGTEWTRLARQSNAS